VRNVSAIGRTAAIAAVVIAGIAVAVIVLRGGGSNYTIKADFQNASQLVKGNLVQVSGRPVGKVTAITLTQNGQAEVTMKVDDAYAPLREGTQATVRASSLSGIANRYVDLNLAPASARGIPKGGVIDASHTTTAVDLDEIFNVFDPKTRQSLRNVFRGSANQYTGKGAPANAGLAYLNPSLAASSRLFKALDADTPMLKRFITASNSRCASAAACASTLSSATPYLTISSCAFLMISPPSCVMIRYSFSPSPSFSRISFWSPRSLPSTLNASAILMRRSSN